MEIIFADLINSSRVPKWVRYIIVAAVCGFVIFLGIILAVGSVVFAGRIFGVVLSLVFTLIAVYLCIKIAKQKPSDK